MASKKRIIIKLESTAGTGCFYTTTKNTMNVPDKLTRRKFDYILREYTDFKEKKVSK